jgi:hypothetical protein
MTFDEIDKLIADHIRQGLSKTEITKRIEADSEMREAAFKLMISDTIKGKWDPAAHGFFDLAADAPQGSGGRGRKTRTRSELETRRLERFTD